MDDGEIVTIIGPNGCGKSTLMKTLAGLVKVRSGTIRFQEEDISGAPPERVVGKGLCYVPQSANIFASLSIRENLEMGAFLRKDDYRGRINDMFDLFPDLARSPGRQAHTLSGGQRQMLAIARALMLDPSLLLLDEPSAGLSPAMLNLVFERIVDINATGVAMLLVEHNAREALECPAAGTCWSMARTGWRTPARNCSTTRKSPASTWAEDRDIPNNSLSLRGRARVGAFSGKT